MSASHAVIRAKDLHKSFGDLHVLRGVSLTVDKGEVLVILGPSGGGKSTLLRCLNLLVYPDEGQVWVDDVLTTDPVFGRSGCDSRWAWCSRASTSSLTSGPSTT